ncbi:MAG: FadR/GntR family transcriptional regulator [Thermodesulfobacteriota bacterium]|nr:FadR/GntR family transcriptional regulator [Thermodesulfobacteriota bacterium]
MVFNQVRQGRISDNIVAQIKNAILTGDYKSGDKLPSEKELEKLFNVSRVPLREALRSLEEMGMIVIKAGVLGGAFVAQMGIKSVSDSLSNMVRLGKISVGDIWEFRLSIEPSISRLAAERRTDWDIQQMEEMTSIREKAVKTRKAPVVSNIDFHQAIAMAAKNPLIILVMNTIAEILMEEFKRFNFSLSDHQSIIKFHREIFNCIKNRDSQHVGDIMYVHLMDVKKRLKI